MEQNLSNGYLSFDIMTEGIIMFEKKEGMKCTMFWMTDAANSSFKLNRSTQHKDLILCFFNIPNTEKEKN